MAIVEVGGFSIRYSAKAAPVVRDVSFRIQGGERVGVIGRSGSGKSSIALGLLDLLPTGAVVFGEIQLDPDRVGMVFQDSRSALDPVVTVGRQLDEVIRLREADHTRRLRQAQELIAAVELDASVLGLYPHQLSGGMAQRVGIAMALVGDPQLLIADEPTTALDVRTEKQVLDLLTRLSVERGMALLLVTHDLAVVAARCPRIICMSEGELVADVRTDEIDECPHPAVQELVMAAKRLYAVAGP